MFADWYECLLGMYVAALSAGAVCMAAGIMYMVTSEKSHTMAEAVVGVYNCARFGFTAMIAVEAAVYIGVALVVGVVFCMAMVYFWIIGKYQTDDCNENCDCY